MVRWFTGTGVCVCSSNVSLVFHTLHVFFIQCLRFEFIYWNDITTTNYKQRRLTHFIYMHTYYPVCPCVFYITTKFWFKFAPTTQESNVIWKTRYKKLFLISVFIPVMQIIYDEYYSQLTLSSKRCSLLVEIYWIHHLHMQEYINETDYNSPSPSSGLPACLHEVGRLFYPYTTHANNTHTWNDNGTIPSLTLPEGGDDQLREIDMREMKQVGWLICMQKKP